jgi:hypothetical protein
MTLTHYMKVHDKEFLGSHDLYLKDGSCPDIVVTIASVEPRTIVGHGGQEKPANVAFFTDRKVKPLILNREAEERIKGFANSPMIEKWSGINLRLFVNHKAKQVGGGVGDGLRIRSEQPVTILPDLNPSHDKWAGAVQSYKDNGEPALVTIAKYFTLTESNKAQLIKEAQSDAA